MYFYSRQDRAPGQCRRGFTLVELLVVIAIIGILVALLLPAVQAAREAARRTQCKNNVKNIALGCLLHEDSRKFLPSGGWGRLWTGDPNRGSGPNQPGSWLYNILPHVEESAVHDLGMGMTAGSAPFKQALSQANQMPIGLFHCPSRRIAKPYLAAWNGMATEMPDLNAISITSGVTKSDYAANSGASLFWSGDASDGWSSPTSYAAANTTTWNDTANCRVTPSRTGASVPTFCQTGVMYFHSSVKISQISDGTTNTYLVGEKYLFPEAYEGVTTGVPGFTYGDNQGAFSGYEWDNHRVAYRAGVSAGGPDEYQPRQDRRGYDNYSAFGSAHAAGLQMAMCDGSVHFLSYDIDSTLHSNLAMRADGNQASLEGQ